MEKVETPKYRPFHRRYDEAFANRVRVDAERHPDQVRQETPEREPDWPCESPSESYLVGCIICLSCWMWQKVLVIFTETIRYTET